MSTELKAVSDINEHLDGEADEAAADAPEPIRPARHAGWIFKHSSLDSLLVSLAALEVAATVVGVVYFAVLPWWALVPLGALITLLVPANVNCISHNHIHNPYFRSRLLNNGFCVFNSLAFGLPQTLYQLHHLNHHRWNNDAKGPDGTTKDWSSLYRYSRTPGPENFFTYSLLSYMRAPFGDAIGIAIRKGYGLRLLIEALTLAAFLAGLLILNWRGALFFYLPLYYLGWSLSSAENYFRHWGTTPGDRYANAVSSYNPVYNALTFQNGYHQEHHTLPQAHWTRMHEVYEKHKDNFRKHGTRVLRGPHFLAFLEPPPIKAHERE